MGDEKVENILFRVALWALGILNASRRCDAGFKGFVLIGSAHAACGEINSLYVHLHTELRFSR
jgi:hypothetical protein